MLKNPFSFNVQFQAVAMICLRSPYWGSQPNSTLARFASARSLVDHPACDFMEHLIKSSSVENVASFERTPFHGPLGTPRLGYRKPPV